MFLRSIVLSLAIFALAGCDQKTGQIKPTMGCSPGLTQDAIEKAQKAERDRQNIGKEPIQKDPPQKDPPSKGGRKNDFTPTTDDNC